eukprot:Skav236544  [mRNA]  locus=scaffold1774:147683:148288:- [translate_table: standard]
MFPNPLHQSQGLHLPIAQPLQGVTPVATPGIPAPAAVQQVVQDAAEAMVNLPVDQGGNGGKSLTPHQQQQLQAFAQQQATCHQQLQQLAQAVPAHAARPIGITAFGHQKNTGTLSVHSSPGAPVRPPHAGATKSPPGQRQPKIPKNNQGDVHLQASSTVTHHGIATPVPASPAHTEEEPKSPIPVPTEIASEDGDALEKMG